MPYQELAHPIVSPHDGRTGAGQQRGGDLWVAVPFARHRRTKPRVSWRPVLIQVALTAVLVIGLVAVAGTVEARRTAEQEAVENATQTTGVLVHAAVQPAITDELLQPGADAAARARARLDGIVRSQVLTDTVVRVKLWTRDGRVVYSDEPRLVNEVYPLDANEIEAMRAATSVASVSDLSEPENRYERNAGQLIEVYYPVFTASGVETLFETYLKYDQVIARSEQMLRTFASIAIGALLLILMVQMPISWTMIGRLRRGQQQRHRLLAKALTAGAEERRRIAGALHDGVVQDLAAVSFVVAGSADQARGIGQNRLGDQLDVVSDTLRSNIRALRSLLVDIYPPSLRSAGLPAALSDLAATLSVPGISITITTEPHLVLGHQVEALLYGVAQECLRNAVRHAQPTTVAVEIARVGGNTVRLEVTDDGVGFDAPAIVNGPPDGHFGLRVICDMAADLGAMLAVDSRPGVGTRWRLEAHTDDQ
jgi:signal transduction histidine kinase